MKNFCAAVIIACTTLLFSACHKTNSSVESKIHFNQLPSSQTGVNFNNAIKENDSVNLIENEYTYMGSGVGIGDFNKDNLPDIFFGANQNSSALYINKGNFKFEDITRKAGLTTNYWATGVSVVDINNDGYDDIYVCASESRNAERRKNHLYINNHDLTFTDKAAEYGLADTGYSTQAVFFDYDKDGDLDMYLLNHLLHHSPYNQIVPRDFTGKSGATDKLYENTGISKTFHHPVYKDVSLKAGIKEDGYGLGVVVSDFNNDNWPDVYVANDYIANDLLWLNNHNGTFTNVIASSIKHQSYSSMGVDAADINNDGLQDITTLDMLPETNERKKMMYSFLNDERYELERREGYEPEFMRNMLQLNQGVRKVRDTIQPFFSEIGQLAGIFQTDWSWSVLMADFDNDGWKDIHITNGMGRDMINNDFVSFRKSSAAEPMRDVAEQNKALLKKLYEYGTVELKNYCFRNNGNLTFSDVSTDAGLTTPSISNGCAYADLDNDGDLDLVVNNINKEAFVLQNDAIENKDSTHHYITLELNGDSANLNGFGTKVKVYAEGKMQFAEQSPVRGYASTVDKRLHFGLGSVTSIDSIEIIWPNDKKQLLQNVAVNKKLKIYQKDAVSIETFSPEANAYFFTDITGSRKIDFKHQEKFFYDFGFQQLLPQKYSQLGPFMTDGDVNGDGLTDFFVGGAYQQSGRFFIQQPNGSFLSKDLVKGEKEQEDLGCLLFDADGDKDLDLFVNSGGYEFDLGSPNYRPRLYINDGKGNFTLEANAIPTNLSTSAQSVAGADYDGDGDIDIFIGGRVSPNQYPISPRSYMLQNNGGKFSDVTEDVCPELAEGGMITGVVFADFNNDKKTDLIVAGEYTPVRFFENSGGKFKEVTAETGLEHMSGQWRSLAVADIDKDGDLDIIAGNLGLNNKYRVGEKEPIKLFAKDLDGNGSIDPFMAYYIKNEKGERKLYPSVGRDQFAAQVPMIKKQFLLHSEYSSKDMDEILKQDDKQGMLELVCEETRSCWLENKGNGKFIMHALPVEAQFAPVNAILCTDVDNDQNPDLILAGNEYQTEVMTGRYDASYGLFLKGNGKGSFTPVAPAKSGLIIDGDVKDLKMVTTANREKIVVASVNDEQLKVFRINSK